MFCLKGNENIQLSLSDISVSPQQGMRKQISEVLFTRDYSGFNAPMKVLNKAQETGKNYQNFVFHFQSESCAVQMDMSVQRFLRWNEF